MAFAISKTSRSQDAVSIGTLEKNLHLLSRKFERPWGFLALSGIPATPQELCGVSGQACTPIPRGFSGHAPGEILYVQHHQLLANSPSGDDNGR